MIGWVRILGLLLAKMVVESGDAYEVGKLRSSCEGEG